MIIFVLSTSQVTSFIKIPKNKTYDLSWWHINSQSYQIHFSFLCTRKYILAVSLWGTMNFKKFSGVFPQHWTFLSFASYQNSLRVWREKETEMKIDGVLSIRHRKRWKSSCGFHLWNDWIGSILWWILLQDKKEYPSKLHSAKIGWFSDHT